MGRSSWSRGRGQLARLLLTRRDDRSRTEYAAGEPHTEDTLIWEREEGATILLPHALPRVESDQPMPAPSKYM